MKKQQFEIQEVEIRCYQFWHEWNLIENKSNKKVNL